MQWWQMYFTKISWRNIKNATDLKRKLHKAGVPVVHRYALNVAIDLLEKRSYDLYETFVTFIKSVAKRRRR